MKHIKEKIPKCSEHQTDKSHLAGISETLPGEGVMRELSRFIKILGDPTRLSILLSLDNEPLCVCDLAELLGMTKSAVSHQLKILRENNLVKYTRSGKNVIYSLADDHVRVIVEYALEHINE